MNVRQLRGGCLLYLHPHFARPPAATASPKRRRKKLAEPRNSAGASITMPFGKYRGWPLADVAQDRPYVGWLLAQPWFAEKFCDCREFLEAMRKLDTGPNVA